MTNLIRAWEPLVNGLPQRESCTVPVLFRKFLAEYLVRSSEEPASLYRFNFRWMQVLIRKLPLTNKRNFRLRRGAGVVLGFFRSGIVVGVEARGPCGSDDSDLLPQ
jgi:hypothetical protein